MNEVNPRLNPAFGGAAFSVCTVANVAVSAVVFLVLSLAGADENSATYIYLSYAVAPVALIIGSACAMKYSRQKISDVVFFKCSPVYYAVALLMAFGLIFCLSYSNTGMLELLKLAGYKPKDDSSFAPPAEGWFLAPSLLLVAVVPAVVEEFFFRGLLLSNARRGMGDAAAVFTTGFCFCIFHANPEQTIYQFICGCAFALIAIRSGSVLPSLLIHFVNNAFIIVLSAFGCNSLPVSGAAAVTLGVLGGAAFAASVLLLVFIKKPFLKSVKGGVKGFYVFASAGIAINAFMWIFGLLSGVFGA